MTAKKKSSKAVTKKQATAPVVFDDMKKDAGMGMEGTDKDSYAIPFLLTLQALSPQVDENNAEYVEGARQGMLFNTVTQTLYSGKEGVDFVPCAFQRRFIRWAPRKLGGGYKGEYLPEDVAKLRDNGDIVDDEGRLYFVKDGDTDVDPDKNDLLSDTRSHFGLLLTDDGPRQVLLALSSTQIKKSKMLMSMLQNVKVEDGEGNKMTPPTFYNVIHINTVPESNDQGSWYGVKFTANGFVDGETYQAGRDFHKAVISDSVNVNYEKAGAASPDSDKF